MPAIGKSQERSYGCGSNLKTQGTFSWDVVFFERIFGYYVSSEGSRCNPVRQGLSPFLGAANAEKKTGQRTGAGFQQTLSVLLHLRECGWAGRGCEDGAGATTRQEIFGAPDSIPRDRLPESSKTCRDSKQVTLDLVLAPANWKRLQIVSFAHAWLSETMELQGHLPKLHDSDEVRTVMRPKGLPSTPEDTHDTAVGLPWF